MTMTITPADDTRIRDRAETTEEARRQAHHGMRAPGETTPAGVCDDGPCEIGHQVEIRHEDSLLMLHAAEQVAELHRERADESELAVARATEFLDALSGMRQSPGSDPTSIESLDPVRQRLLSDICSLRWAMGVAEGRRREAAAARRRAAEAAEGAAAGTATARTELMEATHRRDAAKEAVLRANHAVHESGIRRHMLSEALAHLEAVAGDTLSDATDALARAEDAVARLREQLSTRPRDSERISDLLRAAEWDLDRAGEYAAFAERLPSLVDDANHADIHALYRESHPDAFIVTADRDASMRRYSEAYADMLQARNASAGDDEHQSLVAAREEVHRSLMAAEREVAERKAGLAEARAAEREAWDDLDAATREWVLLGDEEESARKAFDDALGAAVIEATADVWEARKRGYRQALAYRDAVDRLDDMRELEQSARLAERGRPAE